MHNTFGRRWAATLGLASTGLGLLFVGVSPAAAEDQPPLPNAAASTPAGMGAPATSMLKPLTDFGAIAENYAKDRGVSVDEAERRLAVQHSADGLQFQLRDLLGPRYAGQWFDVKSGDVVVATTGEDTAELDQVLEARELAGVTRVEQVASSLDDLEAAQADLGALVRKQLRPGQAWVSLDQPGNRIEVGVSRDASPEAIAVVKAKAAAWGQGKVDAGPGVAFPRSKSAAGAEYSSLGHPVSVSVDDSHKVSAIATDGCSVPDKGCDAPLRGGVAIDHPSGERCSAGFFGYWNNNNTRQPYLMTAGHCINEPSGNNSTSGWTSYDAAAHNRYALNSTGGVQTWRFGDKSGGGAPAVRRDIAIFPVPYLTHWTAALAGYIAMWGWPSSSYGTWQILGQDIAAAGRYGCRTGRSTNYTCGTVNTQSLGGWFGDNGDVQWVDNQFVVGGACAAPGDSGGPFVDGSTALGLLSGGDCSTSYYQHVYDVGYYFGVWAWN